MILLFPDSDTLKLALAGGIVGPDITLAPATLTVDTQGRLYVEPAADLSRATMKNLDRIGVKGSKRHGSKVQQTVRNWLQIVPLRKAAAEPKFSTQAPVLFEVETGDDLATLATEMLRLENDRQSFRWIESESGTRALLRVLGPPYYTLLRAIDSTASGTRGPVRAYLEPSPRVWIEYGFEHPFAAQLRAPEGQLLLLRSPRTWDVLSEEPFQDVYDLLSFDLPKAPVGWNEAAAPETIRVPLKLAPGNAADVPELWVLRENALDQLDQFVRDADATLLQRLTFAVATDSAGAMLAVLRTRPSKLPPPALLFENAIGFKPFWKLPNLFLPTSRRLHPALRRDAVRRLLADDPDQVVWLQPGANCAFTPESVPDKAFRPLEDWVDYVIESHRDPLATWIEATRFDFDSFACTEPTSPPPKPPEFEAAPPREVKSTSPAAAPAKPARLKPSAAPQAELVSAPEPPPPNRWRIIREELEEAFLAVEGPLDAPARRDLWAKLAEANAGEGTPFEAALCWMNALWFDPETTPREWFLAEFPGGTADAKEFDRRLNQRKPTIEDLRSFVVLFLYAAEERPEWLPEFLPKVQAYFEANEASMPVRAVWLVAMAQAELKDRDVLGLARVRDRLLLRLLEEGLIANRDLPTFLQFERKDSERIRYAREKALEMHRAVRAWTEHVAVNLPYVDLMFSFALARLGEQTAAKALLEDARQVMETPLAWPPRDTKDEFALIAAITCNYTFKAFQHRIRQALGDSPAGLGLGADLAEELDAIGKKGRTAEFDVVGPHNNKLNPFARADYFIRRLMEQSRILESFGSQNPYVTSGNRADESAKARTELIKIADKARFVNFVRRQYQNGVPNTDLNEFRIDLLHDAIPLAPVRAGEEFTVELLGRVLVELDPARLAVAIKSFPPTTAELHGRLLERSLSLAAHFNRPELVQKLADRFIELIRVKSDKYRVKLINVVDRQCFRTLIKLGFRDQIHRILLAIESACFQAHRSFADLKANHADRKTWPAVVQSLLSLAGGSASIGRGLQHQPILHEARALLLDPESAIVSTPEYAELARAYVRAISKGSAEVGLPLIIELFRKMPSRKIANTSTTSPYYSWHHLNLVEETCFALTSDAFALGPSAKRWLDEDEYLVRQRIHADMERLSPPRSRSVGGR